MAHRKKAMSQDYGHKSFQSPPIATQSNHYNNPYDTSWVDNLVEVDFLIKEYLIFRGYHKTWEQFYRERKRDQTKNKNTGGYQVDLIVDQLIGYIRNLKLSEYLDFWNTLNLRIFNKLPPQYRESIYHLDTALKRYYLITARKRNNISSIQAFFNRFGDELISRPDANDWMKWFVLPHIKHPEKHQEFESYFNKNWSYSVQISLKNFLSTALCRFPRPKILAFMILKQERQEFKATISKLKEKLNDADFIIRSLHQQLTALTQNNNNNCDINDDEYETNKLINKAIQQYQSDSIHGGIDIINKNQNDTQSATAIVNKTRHNRSQSAINAHDVDAASLQINEKYFRTGTSPQIQPHKHPQSQLIHETLKQNRHRKTLPEDQENDNNDDVKSYNDSILFNSRPLTPTRGSKSGLFKWFNRGKSNEIDSNKTVEAPILSQTQVVLTPNSKAGTAQENKENYTQIAHHQHVKSIPSIGNLPPLLSSELYKKEITMKTIFVPGVAINSVSFNDNGQRLAYSTQAGVIQVYQFPNMNEINSNNNNENNNDDDCDKKEEIELHTNETTNKERLSPSLLHTFCVSKPNEILELIWDTMNENRLFIAIGNPASSKKYDDHIQIWNVWDKKCEYIISFGSKNSECPSVECIKCNQISAVSQNRLIVSGYNKSKKQSMLYLYCDEEDENEWSLISTSSLMNNVTINCVEFNHNGKIIYVGGSDGYIRIFDIQLNGSYFTQLAKWCAHYGAIRSLHLCHDANSILSIAKDFIVKHWLLNGKDHNNSCKKMWKISDETHLNNGNNAAENEIVPLLCLGPNNYFAVTQSNVNRKEDQIYNVTIKCIDDSNNNNNNNNNSSAPHDIIVGGHSKIITAIDWHKESKMLATCSVDGTLRIFQIFRN